MARREAYTSSTEVKEVGVRQLRVELRRWLEHVRRGGEVVCTSRLTYPEARAALAAARRSGRITAGSHAAAKSALTRRLNGARIVDLTEKIGDRAGGIAEARRLRGSDAVLLACAAAPND